MVSGSPVYYGWVILLVGTFGMFMTTPGQTLGVSIFLDRIIQDLGLSRASVSLMYTLGTLIGSFSLPFIGRFVDVRGPRIAVIIISALFALACLWMGLVSGPLTLLLGFILIRGLGQGALGLVSLHVINLWFVRRRGLAVGLSGLGMAVATALFPFVIEGLISAFGWRTAYMVLGALVAGTILPLGAWLYRGKPELYGLRPDSRVQPLDSAAVQERRYPLARARRTVTFWLFVSADVFGAALGTGLIFHHYNIMAGGGIDRLEAAAVFVPFGFIAAGSNLLTGVLLDRFAAPLFTLSVARAALQLAHTRLLREHASAGARLRRGFRRGAGTRGAISGSAYAHYFGRTYIGSIKGFVATLTVAGTAVGPLLFALGDERFGGYREILLLSALPPLVAACAAPFLGPFRRDGSVR